MALPDQERLQTLQGRRRIFEGLRKLLLLRQKLLPDSEDSSKDNGDSSKDSGDSSRDGGDSSRDGGDFSSHALFWMKYRLPLSVIDLSEGSCPELSDEPNNALDRRTLLGETGSITFGSIIREVCILIGNCVSFFYRGNKYHVCVISSSNKILISLPYSSKRSKASFAVNPKVKKDNKII